MSRGFANNNPGNIEKSKGAPWAGEIVPSKDSRFAQFTSMEHGYRALFKLLRNYEHLHGCDTVRKMINRWAPAKENNTDAYISYVSKIAGVSADDPINTCDQSVMLRIGAAITQMENGKGADFPTMERGWKML